jgi:hypothetical protein
MISMIVCVMLGQFEVGDFVDLKPGGKIHLSWVDAVERLDGRSDLRFFGKVIHTMTVGGEQVIRVECPLYERPCYMLAKWAVTLDAKTAERYVEEHNREQERIRELTKPPTPEQVEIQRRRNLDIAEEEARRAEERAKQAKEDAENKKQDDRIKELRKFARNEPENEALDIAAKYGWDPLNLTSAQANHLTPSQRKAISGIKLRYIKASKRKAS